MDFTNFIYLYIAKMGRANAEFFEQEPDWLAENEEGNKETVFPLEKQSLPEMIETTGGIQTESLRPRRLMEEREAERLRLKTIAERNGAKVQGLKMEGKNDGKLHQICL